MLAAECDEARNDTRSAQVPRGEAAMLQSSQDISLSWQYSIVVATLGVAELVAGQQHWCAVRQEHSGQHRALDASLFR